VEVLCALKSFKKKKHEQCSILRSIEQLHSHSRAQHFILTSIKMTVRSLVAAVFVLFRGLNHPTFRNFLGKESWLKRRKECVLLSVCDNVDSCNLKHRRKTRDEETILPVSGNATGEALSGFQGRRGVKVKRSKVKVRSVKLHTDQYVKFVWRYLYFLEIRYKEEDLSMKVNYVISRETKS